MPAAADSGNKVLDAIIAVHTKARDDVEQIWLHAGEPLYAPGAGVTHAYFPVDSMVSLQRSTSSGATAETLLIGSDAMAGVISLLVPGRPPPGGTVVRSGRCCRMSASSLLRCFAEAPRLNEIVFGYMAAVIGSLAQTALCNRHHNVEQRLCRWLLQAVDQAKSSDLTLTHEFIALAVGVRREAVTLAARRLQASGAIAHSRGHITVKQRALLKSASCDCYRSIRAEWTLFTGMLASLSADQVSRATRRRTRAR